MSRRGNHGKNSRPNFLQQAVAAQVVLLRNSVEEDLVLAKTFFQCGSFSRALSTLDTAEQKAFELQGFLDCNDTFIEITDLQVQSCIKLKIADRALDEAYRLVELEGSTSRSSLRLAQGLTACGEHARCFQILIDGLKNTCQNPEQRILYFAELACLLPKVHIEDQEAFDEVEIPSSSASEFWSRVLQTLAAEQRWLGISVLVLGTVDGQDTPFDAVAADTPVASLSLSGLFSSVPDGELKTWGIKLAICLLKKGAAFESLTSDPLEPVPIAAIKSAIRTGNNELFKFVVESSSKFRLLLDHQDKNGDTPLHVLVKSGKVNTFSGEALLKLLINYRASVTVRDKMGKMAVDYLDPKLPHHSLLLEAAKSSVSCIHAKIVAMKDEGNKAQLAKNPLLALKWYKEAIALAKTVPGTKQELALLHSNCSIVNFVMGRYQDALRSAQESVACDPSFYKGYWRQTQVLKQLQRERDALDIYIQGLEKASLPSIEVTVVFLTGISELLPDMVRKRLAYRDKCRRIDNLFGTCIVKLIDLLVKNNSFQALRILILGENYVPVKTHLNTQATLIKKRLPDMTPTGIACHFSTVGVNLNPVFAGPRCDWLDELVIILLSNGASPDSMKASDDDTILHAVVRFCCQADSVFLLEYVLTTYPHICEQKRVQDTKGQSLYHIVGTSFPSGETTTALMIAELLVIFKFDCNLKDNEGRLASDLIPPRSGLYKVLKKTQKSGTNVTKDWKALKEEGNAAYQRQNYVEAVDLYTMAIDKILKQTSKMSGALGLLDGQDSHDLAVLYSNRAECYLKRNMPNQALEDSKESVSNDGHWYKGHWRVGRSLQALKRRDHAVNAFVNAYNSLSPEISEVIRKEILTDLLIAASQSSNIKPGEPIPKLNSVRGEIWAKLAYDLVKTSQWTVSRYAYELFSNIPVNHPTIKYNLKPLCDVDQIRCHGWVSRLILFFLKCGSDQNTMSFQRGDTYLHAAVVVVLFTGDMNVLEWLMKQNANLSITDEGGDTVLHMVCKAKIPPEIKVHLLVCLVENGVDPCIRNNQGLLAVECVAPHEPEIGDIMVLAMQKAREGGFSVKKPRAGQPAASMPQGASRTTQSQAPRPGATGNRKPEICDTCHQNYDEASDALKTGDREKAVKSFLCILLEKHRSPQHQQLTQKCIIEMTEALSRTVSPDLPDKMKRLFPSLMKQIIAKFAENEKWRHVEAAITLYGADRLPKDFAKNFSLKSLIVTKSMTGSEAHRLKIMTLLQSHGAKLSTGNSISAMQGALDNSEVRVVTRLLDEGVNPKAITLEIGDTPVHAALTVALDKDKGNFNLLEKLFQMYDADPKKHPYLNPKGVDSEGNTLLHMACRCKYNKHSQKAVEFLVNQQVPADTANKDGKVPIQYLSNRNDRRAQFLRVVGGTAPSAKPKTEKVSEKKTKSNNDTQQERDVLQAEESVAQAEVDVEEPEIVKDKEEYPENAIRVKAVYLSSLALSRERIKEILSERPDLEISIYRDTKVQKDKPGTSDRVRSDEATVGEMEQKDVSPRKGMEIADDALFEEDDFDTLEKSPEDDQEDEIEEEDVDATIKTFDNLAWEVECTAEVWKCLRDKHVLSELKRRAVSRIRLLASGEWRPYLRKRVTNAPRTLELYEAKLSKGARIIWEVAIAFSARCSEDAEKRLLMEAGQDFAVKGGRIYSEIIRVWDIVFDHDNLYRAIQNIIKSHDRGETCILKKKLKGIKDNQFEGGMTKRYPVLFAEQDDDLGLESVRDRQQMLLYPPASANDTEFHILKFYSFSSALVNIILHNIERKVDFPFRVTDKEHAIIHLNSKAPILLLGRSGTGKTTCCLYRLWTSFISYWIMAKESGEPFLPRADRFIDNETIEENGDDAAENDDVEEEGATARSRSSSPWTADEDADEGLELDEEEVEEEYQGPEYDHLHQVFVTKNPVLCSEVHKNFYELCHAHDETQDHAAKEAEDLPSKLQDVEDLSYPLFITSKQLLLMLDASLDPPHFFERNDDGSLNVRVQGWGAQDDLFGFAPLEDDSDTEDGELDVAEDEDEVPELQAAPARQKKLDPRREVTYEVFAEEVWPKILKKLSVNYHPSLVWTEIMSFIKGSFEALSKPSGHLTKDEYTELGRKRAPSFSGERDKVYELFKRYEHFKKQKFLFDEADLVLNIYKRLRKSEEQTWVIHQLYVDETQDFTQAELCVLLRITQNPNDMFLTGDTAQGIMRGISFRFSDLRSLFFFARNSLHAKGHTGSIIVPKQIYQLTHNYRSHAGILSLASAVLDLMVEFFPESFDRLQKDQGLFNGPPPILLESCSVGDLAILLQGNKRKTSHIEFGAHQAILVVNEAVKNSMPEELSQGIVLTIYEAKGLEFDDVLLYNFFKDSQASKEWRVVTAHLEHLLKSRTDNQKTEALVTIDEEILKQSKRPRPLTFNPNQHKVLNSELKHLYTALTRARVNVWIFDEDEEKRAPMFEYFKARKLVRCITEQEMTATEGMEEAIFAAKSTPENWVKRGDEMMSRYLYEVASKCYRMGGDESKEKIADAHNQALKASRIKDNPKRMRDEFVFAAEKFMDSGHDKKAALCLQNAKDHELAAMVFEKCGLLVEAAKMYLRCKKHLDSSRCYEQLGNYNKAIEVLDNEELFDQAIDCLERYKLVVTEMERKGKEIPFVLIQNRPRSHFTIDQLSYKAASFYHKYKNEAKMVEALDRLPRIEDRLDFLTKRSYVEYAANLLMKTGKTTEAARMMLKNGKVEKALQFAELGEDQDVLGACLYAQALALMASKDDYSQERIVDHLTRSRVAFDCSRNTEGVGKTCMALATLKLDKELAKTAFAQFKELKPYANEVGMVECLDVIVMITQMDEDFADIKAVIRGVDCLFNVIRALLKPSTPEDRTRCLMYLKFYGLEEKEANTLVVNPRERPRCAEVIQQFYKNEQEQKLPQVERDRGQVCVDLCIHLANMLKKWINATRDALRNHVSHRLQCQSHMEGEECPDEGYCPYLHENYTRHSAFIALDALLWEVKLDSVLQTGVETLRSVSTPVLERLATLKENISSLVDESLKFDSCDRLLDFLVPSHHHMRVLTENRAVTFDLMKLLAFEKIDTQVQRFLDHCWRMPDKNLTKAEVLEKRCKSTDWFVVATWFSNVFRLNSNVEKYCQQLEAELMKRPPKWLEKRRKYALISDFHRQNLTVVCLGRRFYDVYKWLQESPLKAVIEYAKFLKILSDRERLTLFPRMSHLLFWQEVMLCVAVFIIARLLHSPSVRFCVPATYLATIPFVNATFPKGPTIQELVHNSADKRDNIQVVQDRLKQIARVLCIRKIGLLKTMFAPRKATNEVDYLLAERCLVLALVFLVNVKTFLSVELESPLMTAIMRLTLPEDAPRRLGRTLDAVKKAKGIVDIVGALRDLLQEREEEYLLMCSWRWDPKRRQGAQYQAIGRLDSFNPCFHVFDRNNMEHEEDIPLDMDESEELGLTVEEAQKRLEDHQQYEENLRRDKCAKKLQRFFRWVVLLRRIESKTVKDHCLKQDMKELVAHFEVNEKLCGICGIPFHSEESMEVTDLPEDDDMSGRQSPEFSGESSVDPPSSESKSLWTPDKPKAQAQSLEGHRKTKSHLENKFNYEAFKRVYGDYFTHRFTEIRKFIHEKKLDNQDDISKHYKHPLAIERLTNGIDEVLKIYHNILNDRLWKSHVYLRNKLVELLNHFEDVKFDIGESSSMEKTVTQAEAAFEAAAQRPMDREPEESEMIDVVEEPVPRKEKFRPKGRGGGGRARGRDFQGRGGYEGRDGYRDTGYRGRGRGQGLGPRNHHHRDFNPTDLPPRMRRMQAYQQQWEQTRHQVPY